MKVAAVGDVHGSKYLSLFRDSLPEADLFLLAGDIARAATVSEFAEVVDLVDLPMVAVFGNQERPPQKFKSAFPEITFLEEELFEFDGLEIVGSSGVLDDWRGGELFERRIEKIKALLSPSSILLTHFAPTYATLEGEGESAYPRLGSMAMERILREKGPRMAIHAHAHCGKREATVGGVPVKNVSLPLNGRVTVMEL